MAAAEVWRALAACKGVPPEVFYSERAADVEMAMQCCGSCPVQQPCREEARLLGEYGTWGAETETAREQAGHRPVRVVVSVYG